MLGVVFVKHTGAFTGRRDVKRDQILTEAKMTDRSSCFLVVSGCSVDVTPKI